MPYTSVKVGFFRHPTIEGVTVLRVKIQSGVRKDIWSYLEFPVAEMSDAKMRYGVESAAEMLGQKQHDEYGDDHDSRELRSAAISALDDAIRMINERRANMSEIAVDKTQTPTEVFSGAPTKFVDPNKLIKH